MAGLENGIQQARAAMGGNTTSGTAALPATGAAAAMAAAGPPQPAKAGGTGGVKDSTAQQPGAQPGGQQISGVVQLAGALAGKVSPTDTVFVFARATQGPRMPLAIL